MPDSSPPWKPVQINTELAREFREIVTAGWSNTSDGNVEAPTGHFACVNIELNELKELLDAVFEGNLEGPAIYPGHYLVVEDSDGNTELHEYLTKQRLLEAYNALRREFARWDCDTCPECDREGSIEPVTLDHSEKKCVACGHHFDPGFDLDEVTF